MNVRGAGRAKAPEGDHGAKIAGAGMALGLVLMFARAQVVGFRYIPSVLVRLGARTLAAYYDFLYAAVLTGAFLIVLLLVRKRRGASRLLYGGFIAAAISSVLAGFANVKIVAMLGRPLSYQWLYYSDFLRSQDARNAIYADLSWDLVLTAAAGVFTFLVVARGLQVGLVVLRRAVGPRRMLAIVIAGPAAYFLAGGIVLSRRDWDIKALENPVFSLARSVIIARRSPRLLTMPTSTGTVDFEPQAPRPSATPASGEKRIRNVLVVVLESVPAGYLETYGGPYPVTPELMHAAGRSRVFENIYANCPTTSFSLVSLLLSTYAGLSFDGLTDRRPDVAFPSLSSELKERGYRTAFFSSSDLRHEHCDEFLAHRQFDAVKDQRGFHCDTPLFRASTPNWPFLDGVDDECTASALLQWIQADPRSPYFAVLWTMMTHYPYFAGEKETEFGVGEAFNRYLNGLRHDDRMLGRVLKALEESGQDRSTLVVVIGDHGESFGQHGQWTHAQNLYEESVHVPLVLINPELFHGERSSTVGGVIDVAPTILDLMGFDPPAPWQGRSLLAPERSGRAYFFAPWSDLLFGFREGNLKVIYDASDNHFEVYDVAKDPTETINHRAESREVVAIGQQRLAAWVQYQDRMMRGLLGDRPK